VTDGLQVLRYNQTMAYIDHMDWIDDLRKKEEHNYDSMRLGSNRFATILLYFTDINEEAGGQTVFTKALPLGVEKEVPFHEVFVFFYYYLHSIKFYPGALYRPSKTFEIPELRHCFKVNHGKKIWLPNAKLN